MVGGGGRRESLWTAGGAPRAATPGLQLDRKHKTACGGSPRRQRCRGERQAHIRTGSAARGKRPTIIQHEGGNKQTKMEGTQRTKCSVRLLGNEARGQQIAEEETNEET